MRTSIALMLLLAGCPGPPVEDPPDTSQPPIDSFLLPPSLYLVFISVSFGYDPDTDEAAAAVIDASQDFPTLLLGVATESWSGSLADTEAVCFATLEAGSALPRAEWVEGSDALFGVDFPPFDSVQDNCAGFLDDTRYPDLSGTLARATWSMGITPRIDPEYRDQLIRGGVSEERIANNIGGVFRGTLGEAVNSGGLYNAVLTEGVQVDDRFAVTEDEEGDRIVMTPAEMVVGNTLQRGFYSSQAVITAEVLDIFYR